MLARLKTYAFRAALFALLIPSIAIPGAMLAGVTLELAMAQAGLEFGPNGKIVGKVLSQGPLPTATNATVTAGSTDVAGSATVTLGGTNVVLTFNTAWNFAPTCVVATRNVNTTSTSFVPTTTTLTISGTNLATSAVVSWFCIGSR